MECNIDQLAAYMKQRATSGAFRMRVSATRIFGFIETERGGKVRLTSLGRRVADSNKERKARAESFLLVALYAAINDKFKGYSLPPTKALEREMVELGVSSKQSARARQAFERSAEQAGYFQHGNDRLVEPAFSGKTPETKPIEPPPVESKRNGGGGDDGGDSDLHPFVQGLLQTLPETGSMWPSSGRDEWLNAASQIFKLIYKDEAPSENVFTAEDAARAFSKNNEAD